MEDKLRTSETLMEELKKANRWGLKADVENQAAELLSIKKNPHNDRLCAVVANLQDGWLAGSEHGSRTLTYIFNAQDEHF